MSFNLMKDFTLTQFVLAYREHYINYYLTGKIAEWECFVAKFNEAIPNPISAYNTAWLGLRAAQTVPGTLDWYLYIADKAVVDTAELAPQFARESDAYILHAIHHFKCDPIIWEALTMFIDKRRLGYLMEIAHLQYKMEIDREWLNHLE